MIYIVIAYRLGACKRNYLVTASTYRAVALKSAVSESVDTCGEYSIAIYEVPDGSSPPGLVEYLPGLPPTIRGRMKSENHHRRQPAFSI